MNKLFAKLFFGFFVLIIVYSALILYFNFNTSREHYISNFQNDLGNLNVSLSDKIAEDIRLNDTASIRKFIKNIGTTLSIRITVLDAKGNVLADSRANPDTMENHFTRPEIQEALAKHYGRTTRYSNTLRNDLLYVASAIKYNNQVIGFVRSSYYLDYIDSLFDKLIGELLKIISIITLLMLVGVFFFTKGITVPLSKLSTAAKALARGNLKTSVEVKSKDEIGELSKNFNFMSDKLSELFSELNKQKEAFETLISSIPDGIIVLNSEKRIVFANESFKIETSDKAIIGRMIQDIIKSDEFINCINNIFETENINENISNFDEFSFENEIYQITFNYLAGQRELIIVFHNITETRRLEKFKKDFIVNVSHELKTPLTAIKGFIETLEDEMEDEEYLHYVKIVRRNTDRLINIVQDLILLSELEDEAASNKLLISSVDLKVILENIRILFEQKLLEKGLYLKIDEEPDFPKVQIDPYRFEQVFVNLISNSIKYTESGGIDIKLLKISSDLIQIQFTDTGIGIPESDQERVFERFYISEKSRSRKYDGTGIGLSIVKHIILLHKGSIELDKTYKQGTRFIITIPQK